MPVRVGFLALKDCLASFSCPKAYFLYSLCNIFLAHSSNRTGANPGFPDQHGMLPLHTAAAEGFLPCVAAILERSDSTEAAPLFTSADPLAKDANGWDARKHAMHNGHSSTFITSFHTVVFFVFHVRFLRSIFA